MTGTLCVVMGGRGTGDVLAVLADWSAAGLVRDFVWVDADDVGGAAAIPALRFHDGVASGVTLQQALQEEAPDHLVLGSLVPLVAEPDASGAGEPETELVVATHAAGRGWDQTRIRLLLPRDATGTVELHLPGWHNLVLSPEVARGPKHPVAPLDAHRDRQPGAAHEAAGASGVLGLWRSVEPQWVQALAGREAEPRLVRCELRAWDGTEADAKVRDATLRIRDEVPLPRGTAVRVEHIGDHRIAVDAMAETVWQAHRSEFVSPRVQGTAQGTKKVGILEAFVLFWRFLWSGLRNPLQWLRSLLDEARTAVADRVGEVLFGEGSEYEVVWKHGLGLLDMDEVDRLGVRLARALNTKLERPALEAGGDFSAAWRGYIDGGLTLIDGKDRNKALAVTLGGTTTGVLRSTRQCVPAPGSAFTGLDPSLDVGDGLRSIEAFDWLGSHSVKQRLEALARGPHFASQAVRAAQDRQRWHEQHEGDSYAACFGARLGGAIVERQNEVGRIAAALAELAGSEDDVDLRSVQRRTARLLRTVLLVTLAISLVAVVLGVLGVLSPAWTVGLTVTTVLVGLGSAFAAFTRRQSRLFKVLHRRRDLISRVEVETENLRRALRDLSRCNEAYRQFLSWTRALRAFVTAPFGIGDDARATTDAPSGLPGNIRLGELRYSEEEVAAIAARMRAAEYGTGWLAQPWSLVLDEAGHRIGPDGFVLAEDLRQLFRQRAGTPESLLDRWVTELERAGVGRTARDQVWAEMRERSLPTVFGQLNGPGTIVHDGHRSAPGDFMDAVDEQELPGQAFAVSLLSREGIIDNCQIVDRVAVDVNRHELGQAASRVEFSRTLPAAGLRYGTEPEGEQGS